MSEIQEIHLKDYKEPDFKIIDVNLKFELYEEHTIVTNTMRFEKVGAVQGLRLDAVELELLEINIDGEALDTQRYRQTREYLEIDDVAEHFTLTLKNKIYPHKNTELEGLYKSGDIFCTQCEPEGFRRITPYLDRPDVMSVFTTTVIADKQKYPILLSNGNKMQCHESFDGRHGVSWHDPHPKPSYLFALVAGDLGFVEDSFTTMNNKTVALNIYVDKGNEDKTAHAMRSLKEAMRWDEEKYGREYDLDIYNIVAVDSFNMGAMENKGLNIFNSAYVLADTHTATDANFMGIESVISHEYFHNWTGNRITCKNWFQLTLKEGLTVFRDQCFSADMNDAALQRINDVKALRERQFVEDASPTRHPIQPKSYISMNNFYTATVYEKGAEVIRMLYTLLGEEQFYKAMDIYFETFDGQAVTTDDFLWAMRQGGEFDLEHFRLWYDQSGTPRLHVKTRQDGEKFVIECTQEIPDTIDGEKQKPMYYPFKIALYSQEGKELLEKTLIISKEHESFEFMFQDVYALSLNRDFSAPVIVQQQDTHHPFLMRYDTNSFTKYEAAQEFATEVIFELIDGKNDLLDAYVESFGYLLDLDVDKGYKALLLEAPSITTLMQRQEIVDFDPLYTGRKQLLKSVATRYEAKLLRLYFQNHEPQNDSMNASSIAQRALKNRVLKILSALRAKEIVTLAKEQYYGSVTMTDKIAALDVLESLDTQESQKAFEDFYTHYKENTLVMNKYFSLLASASREDILERVMELETDEVYDEKVPNLVRSLVGSFTRNYKYFHAKDGSGYRYLANKIIEIDAINPQMASALANAFKLYPKMNKKNKKKMQEALECIVSTQDISKNTREIVEKILK